MKTRITILMIIVIFGFISCEKDNNVYRNISYIDYLKDKTIVAINIVDDIKYIFTSKYCDTCYVAPDMSHIPTIEEWTVVKNDSIFENYAPNKFSGLPKSDNKGQLYLARANIIYKINDNGEYEELVNAGEYIFQSFTFDNNDNIWFYGDNNGIAFWNKSEFKIYNTQNSLLPTDRIHGLAVDKSGVVWISLDFKGLLKIEQGIWTVIPNSEIPGLSRYSYLRGPKIVIDNSVWFEVFSPDTTSNVLKFEKGNWIYEFPDDTKYCNIQIDSKGTIWAINNHYNYSEYKYSTLKYYKDNSWFDFDISGINSQILTVNADDKKIYIGTIRGLIERPK